MWDTILYHSVAKKNVYVKLDSIFYIAGASVNWYNHVEGAKGLALSRLKVSTY